MQRIIDPTALATLPPPPALSGTTGYFGPAVPGISTATRLRYWYMNMIQEELMAILAMAGVTPDASGTNFSQVAYAIELLMPPRRGAQTYTAAGSYSFTVPDGGVGVTEVVVEGVAVDGVAVDGVAVDGVAVEAAAVGRFSLDGPTDTGATVDRAAADRTPADPATVEGCTEDAAECEGEEDARLDESEAGEGADAVTCDEFAPDEWRGRTTTLKSTTVSAALTNTAPINRGRE